MENIVKEQKEMIHYLHKQAADHVKTREMLIQTNEQLEKEINDMNQENKSMKKELETKSEQAVEIMNLKEKLEICDKVIEELKSNELQASRKMKELQDEQRYSDLMQKVDKDNLERDLLEKSEECAGLLKKINDLIMEINDQKEEVNELRTELQRNESVRNYSSCNSLSDELDTAYIKMENDLLKEEAGRMQTKIKHLEKNKMERISQLKNLEELSSSRQKNLRKLKESLDLLIHQKSVNTIKKPSQAKKQI